MRAEIAPHQAKLILEQLHAEIAGKIGQNREEGEKLLQDMRHVEAVLKLLDPACSARSIAGRRAQAESLLQARDHLPQRSGNSDDRREAPDGATEITTTLPASKGAHDAPNADFDNLFSGIQASLRNNAGKTVRNVAERIPARWMLS